jgi:dihydrofolate synthase/folylpolyglutamate synthase
MLRDKPVVDVVRTLAPQVAHWHVAGLDGARAASAAEMQDALRQAGVAASVTAHAGIEEAYAAAKREATDADRIVVFGSFHTVGAILRAPSSP